jgi:hypothetical protein
MALPFVIPQNSQPPLDANGIFNRTWYLFFQSVFQRIGGATGPSATDLSASMFEDAGGSETNAVLFRSIQDAGQSQQPMIVMTADAWSDLALQVGSLQDQITELTKEVQGIRQGTLI